MKNKINKLIKVVNEDYPVDFFIGNYLDLFSLIQEILLNSDDDKKDKNDIETLEMDGVDIEQLYDGGEDFYDFLQKMKIYEELIPNILEEKYDSKYYVFFPFGVFCSIKNFQRNIYVCKENCRNFVNFSNNLLDTLEKEDLYKKIMDNYFYYYQDKNKKLYNELEDQVVNNFKYLENLKKTNIDEQIYYIEMTSGEMPDELKKQNKKIMEQAKQTINLYLLGIVVSHFYFQKILNNIVFKEENKDYFKN